MDRSTIYELCHPITGEVRYVGKAVNAAKRLAGHLKDSKRRDTPVYRWIRKLAREGYSPVLRVVESDCLDWKESEKALIAKYREARVRLLNVADGGDQPYCSYETRKANGLATIKRLQSVQPEKKESVMEVAKDGYLFLLSWYRDLGRTTDFDRVHLKLQSLQ